MAELNPEERALAEIAAIPDIAPEGLELNHFQTATLAIAKELEKTLAQLQAEEKAKASSVTRAFQPESPKLIEQRTASSLALQQILELTNSDTAAAGTKINTSTILRNYYDKLKDEHGEPLDPFKILLICQKLCEIADPLIIRARTYGYGNHRYFVADQRLLAVDNLQNPPKAQDFVDLRNPDQHRPFADEEAVEMFNRFCRIELRGQVILTKITRHLAQTAYRVSQLGESLQSNTVRVSRLPFTTGPIPKDMNLVRVVNVGAVRS